ncbi:hypothetical protein B0J14DRAFT_639506 [Halenospora varia]|nr:hypothetical protein B0J14DRAFT_639506 [Halenospora varia]
MPVHFRSSVPYFSFIQLQQQPQINIFNSTSFILFAILSLPSATLAENCNKIPGISCYVCGRADNSSPWEMLYTTDPVEASLCTPGGDPKHPDCCNFYNASEPWPTSLLEFPSHLPTPNNGHGNVDTLWSGPRGQTVPCTYKKLKPNNSVGGNTCSSNRVDVDAFTFADRDFTVDRSDWDNFWGDGPRSRIIKKGIWVKFDSATTVQCDDFNENGVQQKYPY